MPRPGHAHADAEAEDVADVTGGDARDSDADFEQDAALPGGDGQTEENEAEHTLDLDYDYRPKYSVMSDELGDIVHRRGDAEKHIKNKHNTGKKDILQAFMQDHKRAYATTQIPHQITQHTPATQVCSSEMRKQASQHQGALLAARKSELEKPLEQGSSMTATNQTDTEQQDPQSRSLSADEIPRSPIHVAIELIARSGVWRSKEQYLATLFVLQPVQQLWEHARRKGQSQRLHRAETYTTLAADIGTRRVFLHGPGGSGKTFCMVEVTMKVIKMFFGQRAVKAIAAANSAARLLGGKTMHAAGKMTRQQSLQAKNLRPRKKAKDALTSEWHDTLLLLADEIGTAAPPLLGGVSRRASHGRKEICKLDPTRMVEQPFGEILLQVVMGDLLQLNPVASHSLVEALLRESTIVPGVPKKTTDEDRDGYAIFRKLCENVVLFNGSHRFLDDNLPKLLEIMRTKGGAKVPAELKAKVAKQIASQETDSRLSTNYEQEGNKGFFAYGARVAIQWEQVARLQQLHVVASAKVSTGPKAVANIAATGKPDVGRLADNATAAKTQGQMVYYFQAVDKFTHKQTRQLHMEALKFVNLSKSAGLQGMAGTYLGMRVRLNKKLLPPEIVQEATGEIVGITFHPNEKFGGGHGSSNLRPGDDHPCWQIGHVKCDYLPLHVEVPIVHIAYCYAM